MAFQASHVRDNWAPNLRERPTVRRHASFDYDAPGITRGNRVGDISGDGKPRVTVNGLDAVLILASFWTI